MSAGAAVPSPPAAPPHRVRLPVNRHDWEAIAFLHWAYAPDVVQRLLPDGLEALVRDGRAWVGVTPFRIRVRAPFGPTLPRGEFPETNVRTYVRGPDGRQGLWFLRMEVSAAWFVTALRSLGLPYHRMEMAVEAGEGAVRYRSRPPAGERGGHAITVVPGVPLDPPSGGPFERFLTARWAAYHVRGALLRTPVEHPPWPLHAADVERCEVDALLIGAGLPAPVGPPVAHWSPGVAVRVGPPRLVRRG